MTHQLRSEITICDAAVWGNLTLSETWNIDRRSTTTPRNQFQSGTPSATKEDNLHPRGIRRGREWSIAQNGIEIRRSEEVSALLVRRRRLGPGHGHGRSSHHRFGDFRVLALARRTRGRWGLHNNGIGCHLEEARCALTGLRIHWRDFGRRSCRGHRLVYICDRSR